MQVAVGRLQLSVTVATQAAGDPPARRDDPSLERVEREHRRNVRLRAIEADRSRWELRQRYPA